VHYIPSAAFSAFSLLVLQKEHPACKNCFNSPQRFFWGPGQNMD